MCAGFVDSRAREVDPIIRVWRGLKRVESGIPTPPSLIFIRSVPMQAGPEHFIANSPFLDNPAVYALDLGPRNAELMRAFPNRRACRHDFRAGQKQGALSEISGPRPERHRPTGR